MRISMNLSTKTKTIMYLCGIYQTMYNIIIIYFTSNLSKIKKTIPISISINAYYFV